MYEGGIILLWWWMNCQLITCNYSPLHHWTISLPLLTRVKWGADYTHIIEIQSWHPDTGNGWERWPLTTTDHTILSCVQDRGWVPTVDSPTPLNSRPQHRFEGTQPHRFRSVANWNSHQHKEHLSRKQSNRLSMFQCYYMANPNMTIK